jgi:mevalonate kinase
MTAFAKSKASAPGKVILFGEHAVVYGVTAIAAALSDLRIFVEISSIPEPRLQVCLHDIQVADDNAVGGMASFQHSQSLQSILPAFAERTATPLTAVNPDDAILDKLKALLDASFPQAALQGLMAIMYLTLNVLPDYLASGSGLAFDVRSVGLPIGAGLGSSAAFSVALSAALFRMRQGMEPDVPAATPSADGTYLEIPASLLPTVNAWAYAAEVVIHGAPSGLDNTTSCFGGAVRFRKGEAAFENIPHEDLPAMKILLTNTKVPRSTKLLVAGVRELHDALPAVVKPILDSIEAISQRFLELIRASRARKQHPASGSDSSAYATEKEFVEIGQLFRINHDLLSALGVSHSSLTVARETSASVRVRVCTDTSSVEETGLQCKLTGAGGGGCAITLLPPTSVYITRAEGAASLTAGEELRVRLTAAGFDTFESGLAGGGARWHPCL